MRDDMFKVIVERPRLGVRGAPRIKARLDPAPERTKVGMRRAAAEQTGWRKSLNENLAPLRRYLWKQRNRPWAQVYSEICAKIDARHTVKQHARDHLENFIVIRVSRGRDGTLLGQSHFGRPWPLHECRQALYVDPRDGIIKETARLRRQMGLPPVRRWRRAPPRDSGDVVVLNGMEELRRIAGIWYAIGYRQDPTAPAEARVHDLLRRQRVWPGERHAAAKRQLSGAELAAHGLRNAEWE